jgi:hypothetical protein
MRMEKIKRLGSFVVYTLQEVLKFWYYDRTPWTGDRPNRKAFTCGTAQYKTGTYIHASCGILCNNLSFRAA